MSIISHAKKDPFAAITLILALGGVVFSLANYLIASKLAPIVERVSAIEQSDEKQNAMLGRFSTLEEIVKRIDLNQTKIADKLGVVNK